MMLDDLMIVIAYVPIPSRTGHESQNMVPLQHCHPSHHQLRQPYRIHRSTIMDVQACRQGDVWRHLDLSHTTLTIAAREITPSTMDGGKPLRALR